MVAGRPSQKVVYQGIAASSGFAAGPAFVLGRQETAPSITSATPASLAPDEVPVALERLRQGFARAGAELRALAERAAGEAESAILNAQLLMLEDPTLIETAEGLIRGRLQSPAEAAAGAAETFARQLESLDDPYLRERAADVRDIGQRLRRVLADPGETGPGEAPSLPAQPSVIVARELFPSDTVSLPRHLVLAFVAGAGGKTSHAAILARAYGIPAVLGLGDAWRSIGQGQILAVDGDAGSVELDPDPEALAASQARASGHAAPSGTRVMPNAGPAVTIDGCRITVAGNAGSPADVSAAVAAGAEGIGLFRTEFLFLNRHDPPSEEEQYVTYRAAVEAAAGHPVIFRTLDAGGDKPIPFLNLSPEANPFLGHRGIRISLDRPEDLRTQLRAILCAGAHGPVKIMFPMISDAGEAARARDLLKEAADILRAQEAEFAWPVECGVMIEVPSAALTARSIARHVDFFSIGSNDLTQYTLAVDRANERVAPLYDHFHPSVLRLIGLAADAAREAGIWIGICGELAGEPLAAPVLVGLGLTELSMNAPSVPAVAAAIRALTTEDARQVALAALELPTAEEVRKYLTRLVSQV